MIQAFDFSRQFASYFQVHEVEDGEGNEIYYVRRLLHVSEIPRFLKNLEINNDADPFNRFSISFDGLMSIILNWKKVSEELKTYCFKLVFKLMNDCVNYVLKNYPHAQANTLDDNKIKSTLYIFIKLCDILSKEARPQKSSKKSDFGHDRSIEILSQLFASKFWLSLPQDVSNDAMFLFTFEYLLSYIEIYSTPKNTDVRNSFFELLWLLIDLNKSPLELSTKIFANITYVQQATDCFANFLSIKANSEKLEIIIKYIFRELAQIMQMEADSDSVSQNTIKLLSDFIVSIGTNSPNVNLSTAQKLFQKIQFCESPQLRQAILVSFCRLIINKSKSDSTSPELEVYKNQLIDKLELHSLDTSSMVRAKSIQCLEELMKAKLINFCRSKEILVCIANSVYDDKVYVRKAALNALVSFTVECELNISGSNRDCDSQITSLKHEILEIGNPLNIDTQIELWNAFESHIKSSFDPKFLPDIRKDFPEHLHELDEMLVKCVNVEKMAETFYFFLNFQQVHHKKILMYENPYYFADLGISDKDWQDFHSLLHVFRDFFYTKSIVPDKQNKEQSCIKSMLYVIEFQRDCKIFFEEIVEACEKMLISESVTDVSEAIYFLMHMIRMNFSKTENILSSIISLYSLDQAKSIRDTIRNNFVEIFFKSNLSSSENHERHVMITKSLMKISEIIGKCDYRALKELIFFFVNDNLITDTCIKQLIIICISENLNLSSKVSLLKLLNIISAVDDSIIVSNYHQLVSHAQSLNSLIFLYEVSHILITLCDKKDHKFQRFNTDSDIFNFYIQISCENLHIESSKIFKYLNTFILAIFHCFNFPFEAIDKFVSAFTTTAVDAILKYITKEELSPHDCKTLSTLICNIFTFSGFLAQATSVFVSKTCLDLVCKQNENNFNTNISDKEINPRDPKTKKMNEKRSSFLNSKESPDLVALNEKMVQRFDKIMNNELLDKHCTLGMLYKFLNHFLNDIITYDKISDYVGYDDNIFVSSNFALSKICLVNQNVAKQHLAKLFKIYSNFSSINLCINLPLCFADICSKYPVIFDTDGWKNKLCDGLKSENLDVRINTLYSLSWLISKDIFKIKGNIFIIAKCLTDEDMHVIRMAKGFFKELSEKGNQLYNVMVDILTYFTEIDLDLPNEKFMEAIDFFFTLFKSSNQIVNLIEIMCQRMNSDKSKDTLARLSHCITTLPRSERGLKKIIQSFDIFSHALVHKEVEINFQNFIKSYRLSGKNDSKHQLDEFENAIRSKLKALTV
ncbi:MAG: Ncapd2p [Marteilia pararefringens]